MDERIKPYLNKIWNIVAEMEAEATPYEDNEDLFQVFFEFRRLLVNLEGKYRILT